MYAPFSEDIALVCTSTRKKEFNYHIPSKFSLAFPGWTASLCGASTMYRGVPSESLPPSKGRAPRFATLILPEHGTHRKRLISPTRTSYSSTYIIQCWVSFGGEGRIIRNRHTKTSLFLYPSTPPFLKASDAFPKTSSENTNQVSINYQNFKTKHLLIPPCKEHGRKN